MIKIEISNNQVKVGKKVYHSFNDKITLCAMIIHVISLAQSGKTFQVGYEKE